MKPRDAIPNGQDFLEILRSYLPTSHGPYDFAPDEQDLPPVCVQHLDTLLRTIATYLPRQVVEPLLVNPHLGRAEGGFVEGTVMFADISGFTPLSETLSKLGKAGAEEITSIVNHFFTELIAVAEGYGGDLLKFGGDALLLFFGGEAHEMRACWAALHMQETMAQFRETVTSQGIFRLQMSVGIGTGPLFMANLGSKAGMEFAVMGQTMTQMAQAEHYASAGEIFIDAKTYHAVLARAKTQTPRDHNTEIPEGFYQLMGFTEGISDPMGRVDTRLPFPEPPQDDVWLWVRETVQRIQALALFLPPGLLERIKLDPERVVIGGEYRPVTIFFANFYGINEIISKLGAERSAEITAILNTHFTKMRQIIDKYGGVVNKVNTYVVGHSIMALFGAPRAHIDDPERAVRAALEMQSAMASFTILETSGGTFTLKQRIGVNTGLVFAGNVGSPTRQEYSVMGDAVNLSCRLMGVSAEGQVLVSLHTARQTGTALRLQAQPSVKVKGKSQPISVYKAEGVRENQVRERRPLIGREVPWTTVHDLSEQALDGETRVLTLVGNVGLGKSRLLAELAAHWLEEHNALSVEAACPSFGRHTPYLPWRNLIRPLFGLERDDTTADKLAKITARLMEIDPAWRDWSVLIARLLGMEIEEPDLVRALDAQTRQRLIFRVVTGLVDHVSAEQPLLLIIDDLQWADDTSVALVNQVAQKVTDRPLLLALAQRPDDSLPLNVADLAYHTRVQLEGLPEKAALQLLDTLLPTTPQMPDRLKSLILRNAQGNPLFIEKMAYTLIENYLTLDEESGTYRAREDLEQIEVPETINRVIMSRMDRLDESSRNVLKVASVIGKEFKHWLLSEIYPYRHADGELRERLDRLSQRDILEGPHSELLYLFRHVLTREVAYESLLYADRRQLHRNIGNSIEQQRAGRLTEYFEILAYHFGLAEEWRKALNYHLKAARKAQEMYANEDALHHFRAALKAAGKAADSVALQLAAHEGMAEVLDTVGEYDDALAHLEQARTLVGAVEWEEARVARQLAALCRRTAAIYEKQSAYDAAFEWLQHGLDYLGEIESIEAARIYLLGAGVYHRQGKNNLAIEWCHKSLEIVKESKEQRALSVAAHAYYLLGVSHYRLGNIARTINLCEKSLEFYKRTGDISGAAQAYINLASARYDRGLQNDWPRATDYYLQALEMTNRIGDVYHEAMITLNLGSAYLDQGNLDEASLYYQQSMEKWRALGNTYAIALLYNNQGAVALRWDKLEEARDLLEESLRMFHKIGSGDFLPEVHRHRAAVDLKMGELSRALENAQISLELALEQDMRLEEGATRRVLGQIYRGQGKLPEAEQELQQSLAILEGLNSRYETGKTHLQLARLYQAQGAPDLLKVHLDKAESIFEDLGACLDLAEARVLREELLQ